MAAVSSGASATGGGGGAGGGTGGGAGGGTGGSRPPVRFDDLKGACLVGGRGKVPDLDGALSAAAAVERRLGVRITLVDAAAVCGPGHLASAVHHARGAAAAGEARARDPRVELMLYLTGQRQIKHAMDRAGLGPKTAAVAVVVEGPAAKSARAAHELLAAVGLRRDDRAMAPSRAKLRRLLGKVAPAGGGADLEALAMEHTAMLRLE